MRTIRILFVFCRSIHADAISEITSFWEMDVNASDRIAWDSKGSAHGTYFGGAFNSAVTIFGGGWYRGAGAQTPFNSGGLSVPGALVNTGAGSFAYCTWIRRSSTASDVYLSRWSSDTSTRSWNLQFNATPGRPSLTYAKIDGSAGTLTPSTPDIDAGELAMVCIHYNASTGALGISGNGQNWTTTIPSPAFQIIPDGSACSHPAGIYDPWYPCTLDFGHIHNQFFPTGAPIIGRTMFWNGYVPTNSELAEIYNSGSGRDASYFGLSFTAPTRPLTVSLINSSFADDTLLANQGLYFLKPYPLKFWSPSLAATYGDYLWLRSTDHESGTQHFYIGYSASPETLPSSWSEINPPHNASRFGGFETPSIVWNPDTSLFHLYAHGDDLLTSAPFQQVTMMWTSPDLVTWTAGGGDAFPTDTAACPSAPCYNHTGYAYVQRNGTGDWIAQTLLESSEPSGTDGFIKLGLWTSTNGKNFTFDRETLTMVPKMPYRSNQNARIGIHVSLTTSSLVFSHNYVGLKTSGLEFSNPAWPLLFHDGDGSPIGDFLQDVRAYEENGTVWLYAKWSYKEPSTIRLYKGAIAPVETPAPVARTPISGNIRISGGVIIQ